MTKIKICGLSRPEDIQYANQCMPDYIGFVFAPSRRQIDRKTAEKLKSRLSPGILSVGVFVNEDIGVIAELCRSRVIDWVQLHGDEDEKYLNMLRNQIDNPVIKAVRVKETFVPPQMPADYFLFDTYSETERGGSGKAFRWDLLNRYTNPYFLAGGIHIDNVAAAMGLHPFCLDVSSGVETNSGKDLDKMSAIIKKVRLMSHES